MPFRLNINPKEVEIASEQAMFIDTSIIPQSLPHVMPTDNQIGPELTVNANAYKNILAHLLHRLELAKQVRDTIIPVYKYIDREYYSYLKRDADDAKRQRDNILAKGLKPTDEKLSMIFAQIDEAVTYLLTVLAPDDAMYSATAPKEQQNMAKGLAKLMNIHDEEFAHYRNLAIFCNDALRYNLGAHSIEWEEIHGTTTSQPVANQANADEEAESQMLTNGNRLTALDPYNLLLDPSVAPVSVPTEGEFFGHVEVHTKFRLKLKEQANELYNVDTFTKTIPSLYYYEQHEQTRDDMISTDKATDWVNLLSMGTRSFTVHDKPYETIPVYAWVNMNALGVEDAPNELAIWRFVLGARTHLLFAEQVENSHGKLPVAIAMPIEDHASFQTRGIAERLIPYQRFASFILNTHQRAVRKKLYGLTIYDSQVIPLLGQSDVDMTGGKIPANTMQQNIDLRHKIIQFTDGPDTLNTLENITAMDEIMQKILPTNILKQVASLQRATQYQAASIVQGANRRNLKIAKTINSQAMNVSRSIQIQNIYQFQDTVEILNDEGKLEIIDPAVLRATKIEFTISDGLKGLDRLALQINMKEIFNMILQSQQASQQADVMGMADYLSTLFGDNTDLKQFKLESPIDGLPQEQRDLAFRLLQQFLSQQQGGTQTAAQTQAQAQPPDGVPAT